MTTHSDHSAVSAPHGAIDPFRSPSWFIGSPRAAVLLLIGICGLTFFTGLGSTALWEPDEPRFAEATRQMLLRGDYVTPWFNGQPRFEKPILFYWLQLPFFMLLGATEVAARAPAAISATLTVLAVFDLGRRLVSFRAGLIGAACLATTFRFVLYARQGLTDVPVTAAITCGLWWMTRALTSERGGGAALAAWACAGAAVLLKGPVGLLAPAIWSLLALTTGGRQALARTRPVTGSAVLIAVAVPWYATMIWLHGRSFVDVAIGYEVAARFLSESFPGRDRGVFYYAGVWLGDGLPWSLFLIPAFWWAYTARGALTAGERGAMRLAAIWFAIVLAVCSLSRYKLPHYILPAYPAMALAVGIFASAAIEQRVPRRLWQAPAAVTSVALVIAAALVWLVILRVFNPGPEDPLWALPALLGVGALVLVEQLVTGGRRQPFLTFVALVAMFAVYYAYLAGVVAPRGLKPFQPALTLGLNARGVVAPAEPLAVSGGYRGPGLVFYARHPVQELTSQKELVAFLSAAGRRHCVLPREELDRVRLLVARPLRVSAETPAFSFRLRRLLEREPLRAARTLALVTAE